jgi:glucokinase
VSDADAGGRDIVVADIGGTHARFAIATITPDRPPALRDRAILRVAEYPGIEAAWNAYAARCGGVLPRDAAIAVAGPVDEPWVRLANSGWVIHLASLGERLAIDRLTLLNDFAAVAHAVAQADDRLLGPLCGPDRPSAPPAVTAVCGPGTGLGVAAIHRIDGRYHVLSTEGGHQEFAPVDSVDDVILADLRRRHARVSVERVLSGPGLTAIYAALVRSQGAAVEPLDDGNLWGMALGGNNPIAAAALERFCLALGTFAGDLALCYGAQAVVIAGSLANRIGDRLMRDGFAGRFLAKGRFSPWMAGVSVKLMLHPDPGLVGAAAAFVQQFETGMSARATVGD